MPIIITHPQQDEPLVRAIIRDLLKYGYRVEYLQNYPICQHYTVQELQAMWADELRKMERL